MTITPFRVIQGHRLWYQSKARVLHDFPFVINTNLLSCTVSKLRLIIRQIFPSERGSLHFNAHAGGDPLQISP